MAPVLTALQIARVRKGENPATCANYYLLFISGSEGIKRLLLMAMLADAGDESAMVLRAADQTHSDPANAAFWIASYSRRIQILFLEGACLRTGYTKVMLETLRKPMVYVVNGTMLQCGHAAGASQEQVTWCLDKMKCWARMAIATAHAEFPDFTVMHAMSVFNLRSPDIASNDGGGCAPLLGPDRRGVNVTDQLEILASAFAVDQEKLTEQYHTVRPISQATFDANGCTQREA